MTENTDTALQKLWDAIADNNAAGVESALKAGADPCARAGQSGFNTLYRAIMRPWPSIAIIEQLLAHTPALKDAPPNGETPPLLVVAQNYLKTRNAEALEAYKLLLRKGADLHARAFIFLKSDNDSWANIKGSPLLAALLQKHDPELTKATLEYAGDAALNKKIGDGNILHEVMAMQEEDAIPGLLQRLLVREANMYEQPGSEYKDAPRPPEDLDSEMVRECAFSSAAADFITAQMYHQQGYEHRKAGFNIFIKCGADIDWLSKKLYKNDHGATDKFGVEFFFRTLNMPAYLTAITKELDELKSSYKLSANIMRGVDLSEEPSPIAKFVGAGLGEKLFDPAYWKGREEEALELFASLPRYWKEKLKALPLIAPHWQPCFSRRVSPEEPLNAEDVLNEHGRPNLQFLTWLVNGQAPALLNPAQWESKTDMLRVGNTVPDYLDMTPVRRGSARKTESWLTKYAHASNEKERKR